MQQTQTKTPASAMESFVRLALIITTLFAIGSTSTWAAEAHPKDWNRGNPMHDGYDLTEYFERRATKGSKARQAKRAGGVFYFQSAANKEKRTDQILAGVRRLVRVGNGGQGRQSGCRPQNI